MLLFTWYQRPWRCSRIWSRILCSFWYNKINNHAWTEYPSTSDTFNNFKRKQLWMISRINGSERGLSPFLPRDWRAGWQHWNRTFLLPTRSSGSCETVVSTRRCRCCRPITSKASQPGCSTIPTTTTTSFQPNVASPPVPISIAYSKRKKVAPQIVWRAKIHHKQPNKGHIIIWWCCDSTALTI